jgi:hypothetical protein
MSVMTAHTTTATLEQVERLEKLLTDNELYTGHYDRLWKMLEAHRIDLRERGDGTRMTVETANEAFAWVTRQVTRMQPKSAVPTAAPYGIYKLDGKTYMVTPSKHDPSRIYAKVLVESPPRMTASGEVVDFEWEYARGVVYKLTEAHRITEQDAHDLMIRYGKCLKCKRSLKAAKTMKDIAETGIAVGPVCRKFIFGR